MDGEGVHHDAGTKKSQCSLRALIPVIHFMGEGGDTRNRISFDQYNCEGAKVLPTKTRLQIAP